MSSWRSAAFFNFSYVCVCAPACLLSAWHERQHGRHSWYAFVHMLSGRSLTLANQRRSPTWISKYPRSRPLLRRTTWYYIQNGRISLNFSTRQRLVWKGILEYDWLDCFLKVDIFIYRNASRTARPPAIVYVVRCNECYWNYGSENGYRHGHNG